MCGSELHWLQFAFNSAHQESVKCAPISLMFCFTPHNPLSNFWALADLLSNNPDPAALRETWNRMRLNLRVLTIVYVGSMIEEVVLTILL
jgi:hypothetical protein